MKNLLENILSFLASIQCDKWMHFGIGTFTYAALALFINNILAVGIVVSIAIGKEVYDSRMVNHTSGYTDVIATSVGAISLAMAGLLV